MAIFMPIIHSLKTTYSHSVKNVPQSFDCRYCKLHDHFRAFCNIGGRAVPQVKQVIAMHAVYKLNPDEELPVPQVKQVIAMHVMNSLR